jgi:PPOX class probable F420-dependent enzyme
VLIDTSTEFGARAARRLREERVAWLTTVTPAGAPVPSPVWFLWDGAEAVTMYSLDGTPRLRNIESNPRVALHFDGDGGGGDIVVFSGRASIERAGPPADRHQAYVEKYGWGFERLRTTPEEFAARYSVPVRITLEKLRGH